MDWRELFPDADYEFIVRLRRAEPSEFFGSQDKSGLLLQERRHWLDKCPHHHTRMGCGLAAVPSRSVD